MLAEGWDNVTFTGCKFYKMINNKYILQFLIHTLLLNWLTKSELKVYNLVLLMSVL